jgi:hypothetical protein
MQNTRSGGNPYRNGQYSILIPTVPTVFQGRLTTSFGIGSPTKGNYYQIVAITKIEVVPTPAKGK